MSQPVFVPTRDALAGVPNPFASGVVGSALEDMRGIDVPSINRAAFERCVTLIEQVRATQRSDSLAVFGEAGTGKTHLLGRLRDHFDRMAAPGSGCLIVAIRMQTGPSMIWRHIRQHLAEAMLRRLPDGTRLFQQKFPLSAELLDQVANRDLGIVLGMLARGMHVRDAAAWLRGAELPEDVLEKMGLCRPRYEDELLEDTAFQVIRDICRLLEPQPVVFCLDQIEALQSYPGDKAGLFAAGKTVAALHDELRNAAIISCLQMSLMIEVEETIHRANADRMLQNRLRLQPLTWQQAQQLIEVRMNLDSGLRELRSAYGGIWPLNPVLLKPLFEPGGECAARKLIFRCRELFDEAAAKPAAPPESLAEMFERQFGELQRPMDPAETESILRASLPLLVRLHGGSLEPLRDQAGTVFDGRIAGSPSRMVAICNQTNANSLAARFRKILEKWEGGSAARVILLRDERLGISPNAKTTRARLKSLQERGAELVTVSAEAIAALDAMRTLLASAGSGDLWYRGEGVAASEVERWIAGHIPAQLEELAESLMRGRAADSASDLSGLMPALTAYMAEHRVAAVDEAAAAMEAKLEEVVECARRHPLKFGLLDGSPMVLFDAVEESASA